MTQVLDLLHASSEMHRRHAIVGGVVGAALLIMAGMIAEQEHGWRPALAGIAAGATVMAALMTYAKARLWERVSAERQALAVRRFEDDDTDNGG